VERLPKKKTKETQAEQSKAFIEKAREIGADARQGRRRGDAAAGASGTP
jgi:hypothetical protein